LIVSTATATTLPRDHRLRRELNDEVHARPPAALRTPVNLSYLALYTDWSLRERQWQQVSALARVFNVPPPAAGASHFSADLGLLRVTWERHTEFTRYTFIKAIAPELDPFAVSPLADLPVDWLAEIPGEIILAAHVAVLPAPAGAVDAEAVGRSVFNGNVLVGASIGDGAGAAFTDFRIHEGGFSRLLLHDLDLTARQAGRMVQRLLEIDTYRIMALLALPVARDLAPSLNRQEDSLAEITALLAEEGEKNESALLDRLTRLQIEIDEKMAATHYRFSAAAAYYDLVERRIGELRESRLHGLQTFGEFTERRLAPAMNTCRAAARRQASLSERVARTTQLLSTRVDITRETQNQALLESMNRRAQLQLRLQQTVEGLSIAAVTYYVVGLIGYAAKGLSAVGIAVNPELAMAVGIPVVAALMALGVRRLRSHVNQAGG